MTSWKDLPRAQELDRLEQVERVRARLRGLLFGRLSAQDATRPRTTAYRLWRCLQELPGVKYAWPPENWPWFEWFERLAPDYEDVVRWIEKGRISGARRAEKDARGVWWVVLDRGALERSPEEALIEALRQVDGPPVAVPAQEGVNPVGRKRMEREWVNRMLFSKLKLPPGVRDDGCTTSLFRLCRLMETGYDAPREETASLVRGAHGLPLTLFHGPRGKAFVRLDFAALERQGLEGVIKELTISLARVRTPAR